MHSRIFQLENKPVDAEDRVCENMIPDWFTDSIADYVSDIRDVDRENEIGWLMSTGLGKVCRRDGDKVTFNIDTSAFFDSDFEKFKKTVDDLSKIDFNQFASGRSDVKENNLEHLLFLLREACDDKYGFYVWHDFELYTMQSWMRQVEPCGVYYIGGIVDYHF